MKVAVAYNNGQIGEHFGHAECFAIYDYQDTNVDSCVKKLIDCTDRHGHQAMADLMRENDVDAVIVSQMGDEARALLLLQQEGLIKLADGVGINATKLDIKENKKNLEILELEAAQIPTRLKDVDLAVINGNYAIDAGLKVADALAVESKDGDAATAYVNVVAVKEGNEKNEAIQALVKALKSDTIRDYINNTYGGAVVPVF